MCHKGWMSMQGWGGGGDVMIIWCQSNAKAAKGEERAGMCRTLQVRDFNEPRYICSALLRCAWSASLACFCASSRNS